MYLVAFLAGGIVGMLALSLAVIARESDDRYLDAVGDDLAQRLRDEAGA